MLTNATQSCSTGSSDYGRDQETNQLDKSTDRYRGINLSTHDLLDRRPTLCLGRLKKTIARTMRLDVASAPRGDGDMKRPWILAAGHSTRSLDEFVGLSRAHGVRGIVDIRSIPRQPTILSLMPGRD
jgi:hypothetical protein